MPGLSRGPEPSCQVRRANEEYADTRGSVLIPLVPVLAHSLSERHHLAQGQNRRCRQVLSLVDHHGSHVLTEHLGHRLLQQLVHELLAQAPSDPLGFLNDLGDATESVSQGDLSWEAYLERARELIAAVRSSLEEEAGDSVANREVPATTTDHSGGDASPPLLLTGTDGFHRLQALVRGDGSIAEW